MVILYSGLCLLLLALGAPSARCGPRAVVRGVVWYDNQNGLPDRGERRAPGIEVQVLVGSYGSHGRSPMLVAEALSDEKGRFEADFEPQPGEPALVWVGWALRPGYPYSRRPMAVPPPSGYRGYSYTSEMTPIPLDPGRGREAQEATVNVPLRPLPGVSQRLPWWAAKDFPIPGGHFFTQTNGLEGRSALGYAVTNADGTPSGPGGGRSDWRTWDTRSRGAMSGAGSRSRSSRRGSCSGSRGRA